MKKNLFSVFLLSCTSAFSQTSIPAGNVNGTWTLAGSPYNIQGSIQIVNGDSLIIQPGVTVSFQGTYKLAVQGKLKAIGTITDTITFTAANTTNGWRGIRFDNTPATNDTSKIKYCKLIYGKATGSYPDNYGGALFFNTFSKLIISNCYISYCIATDGGGIYCINGTNPIISNNIISHNSANGDGGGIKSWMSNPNIINNTITNNSVSGVGGGIACDNCNNNPNGNSPVISNNTISNNTAGSGGGISLGSICNSVISNNTITNNTAGSYGGGINCRGNSSPSITNTTIANNSATNGGALYCDNTSNPIFRNCILWGNIASTSGAQVFLNDEASDPNFYYCDVQGGSAAFGLNGNFYTGAYTNNINTDPKFVSPSGGSGTGFNGITADWSLQNTSPCIDTGDPTYSPYPATDKAGNARVTVCRIDMGAYEYQTGIPLTTTFTKTSVLCFGGLNGTATVTASGGTSPYTYLWNNGQTTTIATGLSAATYSLTVTESSGCTKSDTITIIQPNQLIISLNSVVNSNCDNSGQAQATVSGGTGAYTYNWNIGQTTQTATGLTAENYSITVTDTNGCTAVQTTSIANNPPPAPSICAVTVDSLSKYNVIVWDKTSYPIADTFFIYRDTANNTYGFIGKVSYDSLSQFTDTVRTLYAANGDPNATTWKYKIAVKDTCGNISAMSPYHKTLFIQNNSGNFSWNDYLIEGQSVPVPALQNYLFQRDNISNGNWQTIQTLSASSLSYTDAAYSTYQNTGSWRVITSWSISCTPTIINPKDPLLNATTVNTSKSNTFRTNNPNAINETSFENSVSVYPNPNSGKFNLSISQFENLKMNSIEIYSVYGELILHQIVNSSNQQIDLSDVVDGIYFMKVISEKGTAVKKIVIDR